MLLQNITELQMLEGTFSIIWILISTIIGIKIIHKSFILKNRELITVGLFWILICFPWYASSITFIMYILLDATLDDRSYLLIANVVIAPGLLVWIYTFCNISYKKSKKRVVIIYAVICIIYEIFLIYFLFTDIKVIGTVEGLFNSRYNTFALVFQVFTLLSVLVTGIIFSIKSMMVDDQEVKWKGRFLLGAFVCFTIGAFFDAALPNVGMTIVIGRLILIGSAIGYYFGFFLPEKLSRILIKSKKEVQNESKKFAFINDKTFISVEYLLGMMKEDNLDADSLKKYLKKLT